jgi:hypothetical protein
VASESVDEEKMNEMRRIMMRRAGLVIFIGFHATVMMSASPGDDHEEWPKVDFSMDSKSTATSSRGRFSGTVTAHHSLIRDDGVMCRRYLRSQHDKLAKVASNIGR